MSDSSSSSDDNATHEVPTDNKYEARLRSELIPADENGVTFSDIGALDEVKESLYELVMLPLRRPDLFKGGLLKPCRGILLFGPPGTGKTMLAKATANEAGASFINVSASTIGSKWYGKSEKNVKALFTLAAKVAPTIIFIDEVDCLLGQRSSTDKVSRSVKNEFMIHWDGFRTKSNEQILVLAATNRPFDLDDAVIRRFQRRIMVGMPGTESREKILRTIMSGENTENIDFKELTALTEGYTGSDLKNLCVTAAYHPVRELLWKEKQRDSLENQCRKGRREFKKTDVNIDDDEEPIVLRPLNMEDIRQAKKKVAPSFASEGAMMKALEHWNELHGETSATNISIDSQQQKV